MRVFDRLGVEAIRQVDRAVLGLDDGSVVETLLGRILEMPRPFDVRRRCAGYIRTPAALAEQLSAASGESHGRRYSAVCQATPSCGRRQQHHRRRWPPVPARLEETVSHHRVDSRDQLDFNKASLIRAGDRPKR